MHVTIVGGSGRIGSAIARDLATHTSAQLTVTGRAPQPQRDPIGSYLALDLDTADLRQAVRGCDLVIHCAGPFHARDGRVLTACIEEGAHYLDVSDHRSFTQRVESWSDRAAAAGVTAILHTGVFPGISNCMARQCVEQLDCTDTLRLDYAVAGSGGAGTTVLRTTFLGLQRPFSVWREGRWETVLPYSDREVTAFPEPFGRVGTYWFDVAETYTLPRNLDVRTVITKFGSVPDPYNRLTALTARWIPKAWLQRPETVEFLARASKTMTDISDRFSGIGIAMTVTATGLHSGRPARARSTFVRDNTAAAVGCSTGALAELILSGELRQPGIRAIEAAVSTEQFAALLARRQLAVSREFYYLN